MSRVIARVGCIRSKARLLPEIPVVPPEATLWVCAGISAVVRVRWALPLESPTKRDVRPGAPPVPMIARPARSGYA
jgi:hypothetical protein